MTKSSIYTEAYILLATLYGGILIGFIYDLYRIFRSLFHPKKLATYIQDTLFWGIITVVSLYVLLISNQGQLRFYNFLGFILGILLYYYLLSKAVIKALVALLKILRDLLVDLWRMLIYPVQVTFCLINVPFSYCKKKTKPLYYKAKRWVRIPGRITGDMKRGWLRYIKKR